MGTFFPRCHNDISILSTALSLSSLILSLLLTDSPLRSARQAALHPPQPLPPMPFFKRARRGEEKGEEEAEGQGKTSSSVHAGVVEDTAREDRRDRGEGRGGGRGPGESRVEKGKDGRSEPPQLGRPPTVRE